MAALAVIATVGALGIVAAAGTAVERLAGEERPVGRR